MRQTYTPIPKLKLSLLFNPDCRYTPEVRGLRIKAPEGTYEFYGEQTSCTLIDKNHVMVDIAVSQLYMPESKQPLLDLFILFERIDAEPERYDIGMDLYDALSNLPVPNETIQKIQIKNVAGDSRTATPKPGSTPITSCMRVDMLQRQAVTDKLGETIKSALEAYQTTPEAETWPEHEFIAEYLMQHGAWMDLNYDQAKADPVSTWLKYGED